ncbi:TPA: WD40 repeat domain-containing protein, partial [bacterium]|nr:WD40 repeat domain-containing protein [bacterium]
MDWETKEKEIADLHEWRNRFGLVHEFVVSEDGEKIAAVVEIDRKKVVPCVNGNIWSNTYERVWPLNFSPDGSLACAAFQNYEWTVIVDENAWEETYDFVWNLTFSHDGRTIAANFKKDNEFGISLNGKSWENKFIEARDVIISPDGKRAATRIKT